MQQRQFRKVIIYGHKPKIGRKFKVLPRNRHTHSYIHEGYYRAFRYLGFDTFWLDDFDDLSNFSLKGSLFLTEDQGQHEIPLLSSCTYVLHHTQNDKYLDIGARTLNLCNFVQPLRRGISFNYPGSSVQKISDTTFYDEKNVALYQPWATNLLPNEFRKEAIFPFNKNSKDVNYIGSIGHEDLPDRFKVFKHELSNNKIAFNTYSNIDDFTAQQLIEKSRISVDIRGEWHIKCGYIPCRIWKSLSYGKFIGTNSPLLKETFGDYIISASDSDLYSHTLEAYKRAKPSNILSAMKWVQNEHTFVNRAKNILKFCE